MDKPIMYNSQLKKKSAERQALHPGTPRPNSDNLIPNSVEINLTDESDRRHQERLTQLRKSFGSFDNIVKNVGGERTTDSSPAGCLPQAPQLIMWVKHEPFIFGILSPFPCPKIGINILRKVAEYCRKKPDHYPELSLSKWSHICKYKIQLGSNDLAEAYFRVFHIISRPASAWSSHSNLLTSFGGGDSGYNPKRHKSKQDQVRNGESWDIKFHKALRDQDTKEEFNVDTSQFLLFLYIQHFFRLHKKYLMHSSPATTTSDEPWGKVPNDHGGASGTGSNTSSAEQQHVEFVSAFLDDMVDFIMILNHKCPPKAQDQRSCEVEEGDLPFGRVRMEALKTLNLILGATLMDGESSLEREFTGFKDIFLNLTEHGRQVDFHCDSVHKRRFVEWVTKSLKIHPSGSGHVTNSYVPLSVMTGILDENAECFKRNKIFWNLQPYPNAWYILSGVDKQIVHLDSLESISCIKINRCTDSHIFLPGVHNMILLQKCTGITVNLGVTARVVKVTDCTDITVTGVGRLFILCDVANSIFHLLTPSPPIICGNKNHNISLTPYNTTYPSLTSEMKSVGISCRIQRWNKPLEIGSDGYPSASAMDENDSVRQRVTQAVKVVNVVSPEDFAITFFPFRSSNNANASTTPSLHLIPGSFHASLTRHKESVEMARTALVNRILLESSSPPDDSANLIFQITLHRFKLWLKETGNIDQIVGLRSLQKSLERKRSTPLACAHGHDLSCVSMTLRNFFSYCGKTVPKLPTGVDVQDDEEDFT